MIQARAKRKQVAIGTVWRNIPGNLVARRPPYGRNYELDSRIKPSNNFQ